MALPSQNARATSTRRYVYRTNRKQQVLASRAVILGVVVVVGCLGAWWAWSEFSGPSQTQASLTRDDVKEERLPDEPATGLVHLSGSKSGTKKTEQPPPKVTEKLRPSVEAAASKPKPEPARQEPVAASEPDGKSDASVTTVAQGSAGAEPEKPAPQEPATSALLSPPAPEPSIGVSTTGGSVGSVLATAEQLVRENKLVQARELMNTALVSGRAGEADRDVLRRRIGELNDSLLLSPKVYAGDPLSYTYEVQPGDSLERITRRQDLAVNWRLVQRVNAMSNPNKLQVGQKLKLVRGPFHAVVDVSDFRCDVFAGSPDDPSGWLFIRSFSVGLGENNSTPLGEFKVKRSSKLENPYWVNPRTGERFDKDDPKNPIGEYWIGIEGVGASAAHEGYGLHGTIDPGSIGKMMSMGCVRLLDPDIKLVYELLEEQVSSVRVVP